MKHGSAERKKDIVAPAAGFFADMPGELLRELGKIAEERVYEKGDMIFYEGENSTGFYMLLAGLIKIYKLSMEGKEQILQFIKPNETFGEVVVFSGKAFPAHAEAAEKSRVLLFSRKDFLEIIRTNPDLALARVIAADAPPLVLAGDNAGQLEEYHNDIYTVGAGLSYNFKQFYTAGISYTFIRQDSDRIGQDYDDHRLLLTLSWEKELFRW